MMEKKELKIYRFRWLVILKSFLVVFPSGPVKISLFDNLTDHHKRRIFRYRVLSFFKNVFSFRIDNTNNKIILFNIWSTGYYHFIAETLVKVALHREYLKTKVVLVPSNTPQFIQDAFKVLAISDTKEMRCLIFINNVEVVDNPLLGEFVPQHLAMVRKLFENYINKGQQQKKVYISRQNARSRRIVDEEKLETALKQRGYDIVYPEQMSFMEQVSYFSEVSFLVSVHGAGLSNMIFMRDNAKILELMPIITAVDKYDTNFCYKNMAAALGFSYATLFCKKTNESDIFDACDLYVDVEKALLLL